MQPTVVSYTTDLWEAWIDVQSIGGQHILYVVGDICNGSSKTAPVLLKKQMQGAAASHLILEMLPCLQRKQGRASEVGYAEHIADINQYQQISICVGEEIIARIPDIEIVY